MYTVIYISITLAWLLLFGRGYHKIQHGKNKGQSIRAPVLTLIPPFLARLLAGPLAGFISYSLESTFASSSGLANFWRQFLIVGPVEEITKLFAFLATCLRRKDLQNTSDGVRMAITVALGFAGGENLLYMHVYGVENTLPRLFLGHAGHAGYSIFWGYAIAAVLVEGASFGLIPALLVLAAMLHGAYNFFLDFSIPGVTFSVLLTIALFIAMRKLLHSEDKRAGHR